MIKMVSKYNDENFGIYILWYIHVLHTKFGSGKKYEVKYSTNFKRC